MQDQQRIIHYAEAGMSRRKICEKVFGSVGRNYETVKHILDEAGLEHR